jgi:precorrin-4/cobalt-precorrin-4 C11-methyltransferase
VILTRLSGRASKMPQDETLEAFGATGATLAIHLAIHALDQVIKKLLPLYGADCPAAIVVRASWPDEQVIRAPLGELAEAFAAAPAERTALILVGRALGAADFRDSALYQKGYARRFRPETQG